MPVRRIHVTIDDSVHSIVAREASEKGVSVSNYIVVAGLARAVADSQRRNPDLQVATAELLEAARRYVEAGDPLGD